MRTTSQRKNIEQGVEKREIRWHEVKQFLSNLHDVQRNINEKCLLYRKNKYHIDWIFTKERNINDIPAAKLDISARFSVSSFNGEISSHSVGLSKHFLSLKIFALNQFCSIEVKYLFRVINETLKSLRIAYGCWSIHHEMRDSRVGNISGESAMWFRHSGRPFR